MDLPDSWTDRRSAIVRQNAAESVFEDLRSAIESSELPIGVKLPPEAALAERYGVSRSVIREALRSAQTLGLTETKTGSGTIVVSSHPSAPNYGKFSARDLVETRPYIEVPAAGHITFGSDFPFTPLPARKYFADNLNTYDGPLRGKARRDQPHQRAVTVSAATK
jgi:DNA-binding transcriptional MocR family regulator